MTDWISEEGLIKYRWSAWQGPGVPSRLPHLETEYRLVGLSRGNLGQTLLSREGKVRETVCFCSRHLLEAGQKFLVERSHELPRSLRTGSHALSPRSHRLSVQASRLWLNPSGTLP